MPSDIFLARFRESDLAEIAYNHHETVRQVRHSSQHATMLNQEAVKGVREVTRTAACCPQSVTRPPVHKFSCCCPRDTVHIECNGLLKEAEWLFHGAGAPSCTTGGEEEDGRGPP